MQGDWAFLWMQFQLNDQRQLWRFQDSDFLWLGRKKNTSNNYILLPI